MSDEDDVDPDEFLDEGLFPEFDMDEEDVILQLAILAYLLEQKKLGREFVTEKEIFEAMGEEWDNGEDRKFRLSELGENIISMADYKKKMN